jgi:RimJ/RimL family protein N-acetyltransferase
VTAHRCLQAPTGAAAVAAASHRASVPVLETARLRLRAPTLDDFPAYAEIMEADQGAMGGPFTPEDTWQDFTNYIACWMLHGTGLWAVELKDGTLVGFITLGLEWEDYETELGWMLLPSHEGHGYATEAAEAARDFGKRMLPTFVSYVDPDNTRSASVADRLGATRDGQVEAAILAALGESVQVWRHGRASR